MMMFQKLLVCRNVLAPRNELSVVVVSDSSSSSTNHFSDVLMTQGSQDTTDTLTNTADVYFFRKSYYINTYNIP